MPFFSDDRIELRLVSKNEADDLKGWVPFYVYHIYEKGGNIPVGYIDLRIGDNENLFYGGHIGYRVLEDYRGNGYAGRACRLIVPLAKAHGKEMIRITCNPENIASRRTIEKLGAKLVEIVAVPEHNIMYQEGELFKCIFEWYIES
jgi:tagatose 1,6-diphosphate aldolase